MVKMYLVFSLLLASNTSCDRRTQSRGLTNEDKEVIRMMIGNYNKAWLLNDSSAILSLFSDSAMLIPNGLTPIVGKSQIAKFWWPNDSSITKIDRYVINVLEVEGAEDLAYAFENGKLSWSYKKGNFNMSKDQESYELTIFKMTPVGWKIVKRIWTDLKNQ